MKTREPHRRRSRSITFCLALAIATFALTAASCGTDDASDSASDNTSDSSIANSDGSDANDNNDSDSTDSAPGEPMNVLDAAAQPDGTRVTVTGFIIEDTGTLFIADALAESFPPQPGGPTLEIDDLLIDQFDGVATEGPIQWRDEPATITATINGDTLTNTEIVTG